jgi:AcrR family transcriptional regulator
MNAAQQLFLKRGVASTTIEQITSGADVAKGTFYLYFSSREDILDALGERFAEQLLAGIKTAVAKTSENNWREKLATWARAMATGYMDSIQLHDIVFFGARPSTREGREGLVNNIIIDHLTELLQNGIDAGAWSLADSRFTAVFLFSGIHGIVDDAYSKEKRLNRARLIRRLEELCFRTVGLSSS